MVDVAIQFVELGLECLQGCLEHALNGRIACLMQPIGFDAEHLHYLAAPSTGWRPLLEANDQKRLIAALKAGALAQGYSSDLWTLALNRAAVVSKTGIR